MACCVSPLTQMTRCCTLRMSKVELFSKLLFFANFCLMFLEGLERLYWTGCYRSDDESERLTRLHAALMHRYRTVIIVQGRAVDYWCVGRGASYWGGVQRGGAWGGNQCQYKKKPVWFVRSIRISTFCAFETILFLNYSLMLVTGVPQYNNMRWSLDLRVCNF